MGYSIITSLYTSILVENPFIYFHKAFSIGDYGRNYNQKTEYIEDNHQVY